MGLFHNRPFALAAFAAVGLALAASFAGIPHRWIYSIVLLACAVILFLIGFFRRRCGKRQSVAILICLLSAILLFGSWSFFEQQVGALEEQNGETVSVEGVITARISSYSAQSTFALRLEDLNGERVTQTVLLNCEYLSALRAGERIRLTATVQAFESLTEDPDSAFYLSDGFSGTLICSDPQNCMVIANGEKSLAMRLSEWNQALSEKLVDRLGKRAGGMAAALVLGNRSFLSPVDTLAFRRAGISHFLALSGLHVGILIAAIERFLRLVRVPRAFRVGAVILLSGFYLAVTGASPSTMRAVCMAIMLSAAFLLRKSYDSQTAIFAALFGIIMLQPYSIVDSGLWLSFLAAGGIVIFVPAVRGLFSNEKLPKKAIHPFKRAGKALLLAISVGLFAFSATLPFSAFLFGEVSVLSVPATLLLSPLLSAALILSALSLLAPIQPVFFSAQTVLRLLCRSASFASEWRGITVRLDDTITLILVWVTALSLFLCAIFKFRKKWLAAAPILFAAVVFLSAYTAIPFWNSEVRVEYFSQKSNEYLLFSSGGKAVAVDCSGGNKNDAASLAEGLHAAGCTELEELVFTHYHTPSAYLLNCIAAKFKVRSLLLPTPMNEEEAAVAARIREEADLLGIDCRIADETSTVSGLTLQWMHDAGMKEPAITVAAKADGSCLVWCNSQFASAEQTKFFRRYASTAETVIFGQHGSTSGERRDIPQINAARVLVGECKSSATPFLPPESVVYQTISGKITFSLS